MVARLDRAVTGTGESGKDVTVPPLCLDTLHPNLNNVYTPAFLGVLHQVRCRGPVCSLATILVSLETGCTLSLVLAAPGCRTLEELELPPIAVRVEFGRLEKLVYARAHATLDVWKWIIVSRDPIMKQSLTFGIAIIILA
jgi:hypothetical protein